MLWRCAVYWLVGLGLGTVSSAQDRSGEFREFIREQAAAMRSADKAPVDASTWKHHREALRQNLAQAWGGFPFEKTPLEVKSLGVLEKEGYRLEKLILQTLPGVWMTALAYIPPGTGRHPAILQVHGHWAGAKQDPHVQARCIGAVKHGFFVLAVDAFGAGERGLKPALGEYHGEMVAATLYPTGLPLSGIQVYENMRAVDYLQSRPEVDPAKIGITGASGGGNQTMYAGAWDERFGAVVPVCSVGNYQSYLGQACCMCEVVPGALRFTEEWGVLGLTAPRGLMVVSATRDAIQFSVGEAKKSLALTEKVYALHGQPGHLRHAVFESPHDYNQEMRQAMYGWMKLHLAGVGDGSPLPDPPMTLEDPEAIRCYPGETRPKDWLTLPQFAARRGTKALEAVRLKCDKAELKARATAFHELLRVTPEPKSRDVRVSDADGRTTVHFSPEPGLTLTARIQRGAAANSRTAILLNLEGAATASQSELANELKAAGYHIVTCDLRATGALAHPQDRVGRAPDHNTAEWSLWIGRPLIGQWAGDVRCLVDVLEGIDPALAQFVTVVGTGPAGLVAIASANKHPAIKTVAAVGAMASYLHPEPYEGQRLGTILPGVLRDVGDVADIVGLASNRAVVLANMTDGGSRPLAPEAAAKQFEVSKAIRATLNDEAPVVVLTDATTQAIVEAIRATKP